LILKKKHDLYDFLSFYSRGEEIANAVTHGIGTVLSIAGLILLVVLAYHRGAGAGQLASFSVYGTSLVLLHLSSTLYHSLRSPKAKLVFRIIDHGSIYLLIAGTYTPFLVVGMPGRLAWILLGTVWGLTAVGIVTSAVFIGRFPKLSTATYVLMGWLVVIAGKELVANVPRGGITLLLAGGGVYMLGIVFYAWKKLPYNHAIWHLFVLGGSTCHYLAILFYLLPHA
jgi:hemolysin III